MVIPAFSDQDKTPYPCGFGYGWMVYAGVLPYAADGWLVGKFNFGLVKYRNYVYSRDL